MEQTILPIFLSAFPLPLNLFRHFVSRLKLALIRRIKRQINIRALLLLFSFQFETGSVTRKFRPERIRCFGNILLECLDSVESVGMREMVLRFRNTQRCIFLHELPLGRQFFRFALRIVVPNVMQRRSF